MKYKNYKATFEFDSDIDMFFGHVSNTRDVITFYGKSVPEMEREFKNSVEDYLEFCRALNEQPERATV